MIIQLRKRHYYTWSVLAILLPLGMIWAYYNIHESKYDLFARPSSIAFSTIISSQQTTNLKINLRENFDGKKQIELVILQPLIGVSNQLFLSNSNKISRQTLLGSLAGKGIYRFQIPYNFVENPILYFEIFDSIKKKESEKIVIKNP